MSAVRSTVNQPQVLANPAALASVVMPACTQNCSVQIVVRAPVDTVVDAARDPRSAPGLFAGAPSSPFGAMARPGVRGPGLRQPMPARPELDTPRSHADARDTAPLVCEPPMTDDVPMSSQPPTTATKPSAEATATATATSGDECALTDYLWAGAEGCYKSLVTEGLPAALEALGTGSVRGALLAASMHCALGATADASWVGIRCAAE